MPSGLLLIQPTLALAALAAVLARSRRGLAGVLVMALGLAGLVTAGGPEWPVAALPRLTLGISAGLVVTGLGLVVWAAARRGAAAVVAAALAVAMALVSLVPMVRQGGIIAPLATAAALAGGGVVLWLAGEGLRLGQAIRWFERLFGGVESDGRGRWDESAGTLALVQAVLALLTLVAPHLHLVMLAAFGAGVAGLLLGWRVGGRGVGPGAAIWLLLLGFSWWYLARVGGEASLLIADLREGPFSPAFEVSAALPLALSAWPLLGLWPFHRSGLGPFAPLAGGALLVRVLATALPSGLVHWQPALYPLVVLAAWHAVALRREEMALAALAGLGLLSGVPQAGWAAIGLLGGVVLLRLVRMVHEAGRELNPRGALLAGLAVLGASLLLLPVVSAALGAEALYTVLAVAGVVAAAWAAEVTPARRGERGR